MTHPLIFTEQRLLPRVADIILTIFAWLGFFWLIYAGVTNAISLQDLKEPGPFYTTLYSILGYFVVMMLNGIFLIVWAKYNQFRFRVERRKRRPELKRTELAASMEVAPEIIDQMATGRIQTVYHDSHGNIAYTEVYQDTNSGLPPPPQTEPLTPLLLTQSQQLVTKSMLSTID